MNVSGYQLLYSPLQENRLLYPSDIAIETVKGKYCFKEAIANNDVNEALGRLLELERLKDIPLFNGRVARLNSHETCNGLKLFLQELNYYDHVKSYYFIKHELGIKEHCNLKDYISQNPDIELARGLGVAVLLLDNTGNAILQFRSNNTIGNHYKVAPSASGIVDFKDSLDTQIFYDELCNELGVEVSNLSEMILLGLFENEAMLKKPGMFFLATTDLSFTEIQGKYYNALEKYESDDIFSVTELGKVKTPADPLRVFMETESIWSSFLRKAMT